MESQLNFFIFLGICVAILSIFNFILLHKLLNLKKAIAIVKNHGDTVYVSKTRIEWNSANKSYGVGLVVNTDSGELNVEYYYPSPHYSRSISILISKCDDAMHKFILDIVQVKN